jgi:hypothetical protein
MQLALLLLLTLMSMLVPIQVAATSKMASVFQSPPLAVLVALSLPDMGIYCLNAARYISGEEPVEIQAIRLTHTNDPRFAEVEESVAFTMRFSLGLLASCSTSYGFHDSKRYRLGGRPSAYVRLRGVLDGAMRSLGSVPPFDFHFLLRHLGNGDEEGLELEAGSGAELVHMIVAIVRRRHGDDPIILDSPTTVTLGHPHDADRPGRNHGSGPSRRLEQNHRIEWIAVGVRTCSERSPSRTDRRCRAAAPG